MQGKWLIPIRSFIVMTTSMINENWLTLKVCKGIVITPKMGNIGIWDWTQYGLKSQGWLDKGRSGMECLKVKVQLKR